MNKTELKNTISGFDFNSGNSFAQSFGGTASNYFGPMYGVLAYGAAQDAQAATTALKSNTRHDFTPQ